LRQDNPKQFKIGKDPLILVYGKPMAVPEAQAGFPSIYKEIDKFGKVLQNNIVRKTTATLTDVLPRLPGRPIQVGESWQSDFRVKVVGIGDMIPFQIQNTLDSVEWESGKECAKIQATMTSLGKMNLIPGDRQSTGEQSPTKGTATFFFAYTTGKLIKANAVMETAMSMDPATLNGLQQSATGDGYASPYEAPSSETLSDDEGYYDRASTRPRKGAKRPSATVQVYGPDGATTNPQVDKTSVKVRLNWSLELKSFPRTSRSDLPTRAIRPCVSLP
jgi:hypothetical protein